MTALTVIEARERISRVKASVDTIREDLLALWSGQAWRSLGYDSWDALCDAEFEVRLALPIDQRREVVAELTDAGMSSRAIAGAIGVHHSTVVEDRRTVGNPTVDPDARITGLDGKSRPAKVTTTTRTTEATKVERDVDLDTGEIVVVSNSPTYVPESAESNRHREPLTDDFERSLLPVSRGINRLYSLTQDDRWKRNAALISDRNKGDLDRLLTTLAEVINQLEPTTGEVTA